MMGRRGHPRGLTLLFLSRISSELIHVLARVRLVEGSIFSLSMEPMHCLVSKGLARLSDFSPTSWTFDIHRLHHDLSLQRLGTAHAGSDSLRHIRPDPAHRVRCFGNRGFLSKYLGLCPKPIFEVVTVFTAPILVEPIRMGTNYVLGQFGRAFLGLRG